jgi:hypothetical protein
VADALPQPDPNRLDDPSYAGVVFIRRVRSTGQVK